MGYKQGLLAGFAGLMMLTTAAGAATRYVSDQLTINMRRGPGTSYRILELLDAGEKVYTLSKDNGWAKVRTTEGKTGFVLTRFLADQPSARNRISYMENKTDQYKKENTELKQKLAQARTGSEKLDKAKTNLVAANKSLKSRLQKLRETSADSVRISKENQKFRKQLMSSRSEVERLRHENQALQSRREGMKIGALILIGGIIIGVVLPLFRRRRGKGSWDSL